MNKRPAFQFYPADWRKDAALQSCSIAARGLWIECMCIAHECEPYGHLTINGKPMAVAQIARLVGLSAKECATLFAELEDAGVLSRTTDGTVYSRRMVRDEDIRQRRAAGGEAGSEYGIKGKEYGAKGGRPAKGRGVFEPPIEPPPSSSSSSSSSASEEKGETPLPPSPPAGGGERKRPNPPDSLFADFWATYPRKVGKEAARKAWCRVARPAETLQAIRAALQWQCQSDQWTRHSGQYIPHPATYLSEQRWLDEPPRAQVLTLTQTGQRAVSAAQRWLENQEATA